MANPNDSLASQNTPDTPEQARERELLRAENERRAHERDLVSIDALLEKNPSKASMERILGRILEKMPEERTNLELMSTGADIQVLEFLAKAWALNPESSTLLDRRKKRHSELSGISASSVSEAQTITAANKSAKTPDVLRVPVSGVSPIPKSVPNKTETVGKNTEATNLRPAQPSLASAAEKSEYPLHARILSEQDLSAMKTYIQNAMTGSEAIGKVSASQEKVSEEHKMLVRKAGQANLLRSVGTAYRDYLSNLESTIRWKNVSDKPKRYTEQVKAIDEVLASLNAISDMPEAAKIEAVKRLDIASLTNRIFVPETKLSTLGSGLMNQPMVEKSANTGEFRFMPNPLATLEETEGRYAQIKRLVTEGADFSPDSVKNRKYEILSLLRSNDSRDDDSMKYNTSEAIRKQVEGDVLTNPTLRKNKATKKVFDCIDAMQKDPKMEQAFTDLIFGKSVPTSERVNEFFKKNGIVMPKESLSAISKKAVELRGTSERISREQADEIMVLIDRPGMFPADFVKDFKANPVVFMKKAFASDAINKLWTLSKHETITWMLRSDMKTTQELSKTDAGIRLYTDIEWVTRRADETVNSDVEFSQTVLEQLLIMYGSGVFGGLAVKVFQLQKPVTLAANGARIWAEGIAWAMKMGSLAGKIGNIAGKSTEFLGTTLVEGTAFAALYSNINGLSQKRYLDEGTANTFKDMLALSNKLDDYVRLVAFLGAIKVMIPAISRVPNMQDVAGGLLVKTFPELAKKLGSSPTMAKWLEFSHTAIQTGTNIVLDTWALLGADLVIRGFRQDKEDFPKNADEIPNFLTQECKAIILYVIGLRALSDKLGAGSKPLDMASLAGKQIEVQYLKNGDIVIRTLENEIYVIKKDLQNLEQRHDRLKQKVKNGEGTRSTNKAEKNDIRDAKKEKKKELKDAVETLDIFEQDLNVRKAEMWTQEQIVAQEEAARKEKAYQDSLAWTGASGTNQKSLVEEVMNKDFTKTTVNHSVNGVKGLDINPKDIRLSDAISSFKKPSINTQGMGTQFQDLLKGMPNIENMELLQKQAETVIGKELKAKYDEMLKDYDKLSPEAQATLDTWEKELGAQAKELSKDFMDAMKARMEGRKMESKWWDMVYMERVTANFVDVMSPELRKSIVRKEGTIFTND